MGHLAGGGWRKGKFRGTSILPGNFSQVQGVFKSMQKKQMPLTLALLTAGTLNFPAGAQTSPAQSSPAQSSAAQSSPVQSSSATLTPEQALTRLFSAEQLQADWFAPDFLKQVPLATIQQQMNAIATQYGKFVRLDTLDGKIQAVYERGSLIVTSAPLDEQSRLTSFSAVPGPDPRAGIATPEPVAGVALLNKLLAVNPVDVSLLSADFLKAVPEADVKTMFTNYREQLGEFKGAEQTGTAQASTWTLNFEKGSLPVTHLAIDEQGKVSGLRLAPPMPKFTSLDEAKAAFTALPGDVSVYLAEVGQPPLLAQNPTRLLGVGSAFKLAILGEVQAQVTAGKLKWTDEVTLTDAMKSLPSGTLQDSPAGSKYTVQDLATRMIRDSDNTATDILLNLAGREGVEARLGQAAIPSTREAFALKNPANIELLRAYRAAGLNTAARREVLKAASTAPLPTAKDFDGTRTLARDVEWFVSTERLCQLMGDVAALPAMQANPGVASKDDFASVSYKGGSEPGVLNLTTQVTTKAGKISCLSATWNRPEPLDENQFFGLYAAMLKLPK